VHLMGGLLERVVGKAARLAANLMAAATLVMNRLLKAFERCMISKK
jgi:hypothetical protein